MRRKTRFRQNSGALVISRMVAWCTNLSIAATVIMLSSKIWSQALNGWLKVMIKLPVS